MVNYDSYYLFQASFKTEWRSYLYKNRPILSFLAPNGLFLNPHVLILVRLEAPRGPHYGDRL